MLKIVIYFVCVFLAVLSIFPFWLMIINSTRSTHEISRGMALFFNLDRVPYQRMEDMKVSTVTSGEFSDFEGTGGKEEDKNVDEDGDDVDVDDADDADLAGTTDEAEPPDEHEADEAEPADENEPADEAEPADEEEPIEEDAEGRTEFSFVHYFKRNLAVTRRDPKNGFNAITGLVNSFIISAGATLFAVYFSSLTAYGLVAYNFKGRNALFSFILAVMMIPAQVSGVGFYRFMYQIHWNNTYWAFIVPAIAAPATVFFMRQYLLATLSVEIVEAARIDGSGEFATFNKIVVPIMMPAIATQAIFAFVFRWNDLFMPLILLTDKTMKTMPIMVSLLRGDIYRVEYGAIYLGLLITVLPLFVIYFALSKYIIAGVALGGVKE